MWYIHILEYYSAKKKKGNPTICGNMDKPPRGHHATWNKQVTEGQKKKSCLNG